MIKRFNRFELKYVVPSTTRDALLPELARYLAPDPRAGEGGTYAVTSLYYDTPDLACFRAKLDGIRYRRKLRVRRYGPLDFEANPLVMVEIKQRIGRTTQKRRVELPIGEAYALCAGRPRPSWADERDAEAAAEVELLVCTLGLRPACLVGYRRRALEGGPYQPGLRVTFDELLWSSSAAAGLSGGEPRHRFLPPRLLVMEVKANDAVPMWLSNLLARHACHVTRFSKYCAGLARLPATGRVGLTSEAQELVERNVGVVGAPRGDT